MGWDGPYPWVFMDELDAVMSARDGGGGGGGGDHESSRRLKTELLIQLDGRGAYTTQSSTFSQLNRSSVVYYL